MLLYKLEETPEDPRHWWISISELVRTKTPKECHIRAKFLVELQKAQKTVDEYMLEEENKRVADEKSAKLQAEEWKDLSGSDMEDEESEDEETDAVYGDEELVKHAKK